MSDNTEIIFPCAIMTGFGEDVVVGFGKDYPSGINKLNILDILKIYDSFESKLNPGVIYLHIPYATLFIFGDELSKIRARVICQHGNGIILNDVKRLPLMGTNIITKAVDLWDGASLHSEDTQSISLPNGEKMLLPKRQLKRRRFRDLQGLCVGIQTITVNVKNENQVVVVDVWPNSPAEQAGICEGDILCGWMGTMLNDSRQLSLLAEKYTLDTKIAATIRQSGEQKDLLIKPVYPETLFNGKKLGED